MIDRAVEAAAQALFEGTDASYADARRAVEAAAPILRRQWVEEALAAVKALTVKSDYDDESWLDSDEVAQAIASTRTRPSEEAP